MTRTKIYLYAKLSFRVIVNLTGITLLDVDMFTPR